MNNNRSRFSCRCIMKDEREAYLAVKAASPAEATRKVHMDYKGVAYVLEVLTPIELKAKKAHLSPSLMASSHASCIS